MKNWILKAGGVCYLCCCCSVTKSCPTLRPHSCQAPLSFTVSQSLLWFMYIDSVMLSNHSSPFFPFSSCPHSFPASGSFQRSQLFTSGGQSIGASVSAPVLPMNIQDWFPLGLTGLISSTPQFESINSSALSLLYGPTLTSIHDYWKNHSFDYTDLCWQSDVSAF